MHCRSGLERSSSLDSGFISRMKHGVSISGSCLSSGLCYVCVVCFSSLTITWCRPWAVMMLLTGPQCCGILWFTNWYGWGVCWTPRQRCFTLWNEGSCCRSGRIRYGIAGFYSSLPSVSPAFIIIMWQMMYSKYCEYCE